MPNTLQKCSSAVLYYFLNDNTLLHQNQQFVVE